MCGDHTAFMKESVVRQSMCWYRTACLWAGGLISESINESLCKSTSESISESIDKSINDRLANRLFSS